MKEINFFNTINQNKWRYSLYLLIIIFIIVYSFLRSKKEGFGGDFNVFWRAGVNFIEGKNLYAPLPGEREFIYPPFAAMFFTILGIFPFKIACFLFYLSNFAMWGAVVIYSKKILNVLSQPISRYALIFAFVLSFKLIWNNIQMIQTNAIFTLFTLIGTYHYFKKNESWAVFFIGIATAIKIIPIFFFFWLIIRGSKWALPKAIAIGIITITVPMLFRHGEFAGFNDLIAYYNYYLVNFQHGSAGTSYASLNLGSTIYKLFTPSEFTIIDLGMPVAKKMYGILFALILSLTVLTSIWLRATKQKFSMLEPATFFLLSGSTWKAHLVSFFFIYLCLLTLRRELMSSAMNRTHNAIIAFASLLMITGKELIGKNGQHFVSGYGFWTYLMLILLFFFLYLLYRKQELHSSKIDSFQF